MAHGRAERSTGFLRITPFGDRFLYMRLKFCIDLAVQAFPAECIGNA
jgi:hypothetical protein